jgi:hypothetical protein
VRSSFPPEATTKEQNSMIDPGSAADWVQASLLTGLLAGLAAAGRWALAQEQHEHSVAPRPVAITARQ